MTDLRNEVTSGAGTRHHTAAAHVLSLRGRVIRWRGFSVRLDARSTSVCVVLCGLLWWSASGRSASATSRSRFATSSLPSWVIRPRTPSSSSAHSGFLAFWSASASAPPSACRGNLPVARAQPARLARHHRVQCRCCPRRRDSHRVVRWVTDSGVGRRRCRRDPRSAGRLSAGLETGLQAYRWCSSASAQDSPSTPSSTT